MNKLEFCLCILFTDPSLVQLTLKYMILLAETVFFLCIFHFDQFIDSRHLENTFLLQFKRGISESHQFQQRFCKSDIGTQFKIHPVYIAEHLGYLVIQIKFFIIKLHPVSPFL